MLYPLSYGRWSCWPLIAHRPSRTLPRPRPDPKPGPGPEAAATLGATPARNFLTVTLPLSVQGIAAGSVIVFCLTIGAFITPLWLGRGHVTVMAIAILIRGLDLFRV